MVSIIVSTDGLYTSFGSDNDFLDYHTIVTGQLIDLDALLPSLKNNIVKRSHFGTEDDISVSCVYNADLIEEKLDVIKAKIADNKRLAAIRRSNVMRT